MERYLFICDDRLYGEFSRGFDFFIGAVTELDCIFYMIWFLSTTREKFFVSAGVCMLLNLVMPPGFFSFAMSSSLTAVKISALICRLTFSTSSGSSFVSPD